jgi:hypothetical protein
MPGRPDADDWTSNATSDRDTFHEWILSLPWVVERPYSLGFPGVRAFAVDCPPVGVRRIWLVTGIPHSSGIAMIVSERVADDLDLINLARPLAPMPPGHVLTSLCPDANDRDVERVLLQAYSSALA